MSDKKGHIKGRPDRAAAGNHMRKYKDGQYPKDRSGVERVPRGTSSAAFGEGFDKSELSTPASGGKGEKTKPSATKEIRKVARETLEAIEPKYAASKRMQPEQEKLRKLGMGARQRKAQENKETLADRGSTERNEIERATERNLRMLYGDSEPYWLARRKAFKEKEIIGKARTLAFGKTPTQVARIISERDGITIHTSPNTVELYDLVLRAYQDSKPEMEPVPESAETKPLLIEEDEEIETARSRFSWDLEKAKDKPKKPKKPKKPSKPDEPLMGEVETDFKPLKAKAGSQILFQEGGADEQQPDEEKPEQSLHGDEMPIEVEEIIEEDGMVEGDEIPPEPSLEDLQAQILELKAKLEEYVGMEKGDMPGDYPDADMPMPGALEMPDPDADEEEIEKFVRSMGGFEAVMNLFAKVDRQLPRNMKWNSMRQNMAKITDCLCQKQKYYPPMGSRKLSDSGWKWLEEKSTGYGSKFRFRE